MTAELLWEPKGVIKSYSGRVTSEDVLALERRLMGDARFDDLYYIISDYSRASEIRYDETIAQVLTAMRIGAFHSNARIRYAYVASHAQAVALIEGYFATNRIPYAHRVFASLEEARSWLAQPESEFRAAA